MQTGQRLSEVYRTSYPVSVGTSDQQLLPENPRRIGLILSCQADIGESMTPLTIASGGASTATTGTKQTLTIPAGVNAVLTQASFFPQAGTPATVHLAITRAGQGATIVSGNAAIDLSLNVPLGPADSVRWICDVLQAGSTADFLLAASGVNVVGRVTVSFAGPAVLDQGINLYPGNAPVILWNEHFGRAFREEVRAISSLANVLVYALDLFEIDCPCVDMAVRGR